MKPAVLLASVCLVVATALAPVALAQSAADVENARQLFREALALSKEKRWEEAIPIYERSLTLKEEPITLYSLGVAYKNTGRHAEALESLRQFLAKASNPKTERFQASAKAAVAELEPVVAHVTILVEPADAPGLEVFIDDREVPLAGLGLPRLIDPGPRTVTARAPGFHEASAAVELESGASGEVTLTLEPLPETEEVVVAPPPMAEGPDRTVEDEGFPIFPVIVTGSGVAVLGAGVAVGMIGYSEAKDAPTQDGEEADSARTKMLAGDIVAGVGGAIAAGGAAWLLYELLTGPDDPGDVQAITPWSDGTSAGLRVTF